MFLHSKITFYFNLKHEGLCSQVLRMCEHLFWVPCWDDAITCENIVPGGEILYL